MTLNVGLAVTIPMVNRYTHRLLCLIYLMQGITIVCMTQVNYNGDRATLSYPSESLKIYLTTLGIQLATSGALVQRPTVRTILTCEAKVAVWFPPLSSFSAGPVGNSEWSPSLHYCTGVTVSKHVPLTLCYNFSSIACKEYVKIHFLTFRPL